MAEAVNVKQTPLAMFLILSHAAADSLSDDRAAEREKMYRHLLEQVGKARVELEHVG